MAQVLDVFANRYALEREIARGGMADVYLATDRQLKRKVAVKVLFPEFARDPSFVERFRREARNAASLNHANIAAVYDWGQERGSYYIVMEYVEGRSLREIIHGEGRIPPIAAARVAAELADALAFAHRRGVIHRDVKPGNVLLTPAGQVKLTDFGIAANATDANQGLTQTGSVMGTATYFSPEQAQGHAVDSRSDVYALGVVLYEMLCGTPPFSGESPVAIAMKHVREAPPPMTSRAPDVPAQLQSIVNAALTKDIDARYQSADEMRVDLVDYTRGRPLTYAYEPGAAGGDVALDADIPTVAAAVARSVIPPRAPRRHGWAGIAAAAIGLGLLATVVTYLLASSRDTAAPTPRAQIPNVVGQRYDAASAALTDAKFSVSRLDDELSAQEPGTVLAQDPAGGRLADEGTTVTLTVSSADVTIPDLTGQQYELAASRLQRLTLVVERTNVDSPEPVGTVLQSDPAPSTKVSKGATVVLTVAVEPGVDVPNVTRQAQGTAAANLRSLGLVPVISEEASETVEEGNAIRTEPFAGTRVPEGSTVRIFVSSGLPKVEVPNVVGRTQSEATAELFAAGFGVEINQVANGPGEKGTVISQNPSGGELPQGSTVTITVRV